METPNQIGALLGSATAPTSEDLANLKAIGGFVARKFQQLQQHAGYRFVGGSPSRWSEAMAGRHGVIDGARWTDGIALSGILSLGHTDKHLQNMMRGISTGYQWFDTATMSNVDLYEDDTPEQTEDGFVAPSRSRSLFGHVPQVAAARARRQQRALSRQLESGKQHYAWGEGSVDREVVQALSEGGLFLADQLQPLAPGQGEGALTERLPRDGASSSGAYRVPTPGGADSESGPRVHFGRQSVAPMSLDGLRVDGRTPALAAALRVASESFGPVAPTRGAGRQMNQVVSSTAQDAVSVARTQTDFGPGSLGREVVGFTTARQPRVQGTDARIGSVQSASFMGVGPVANAMTSRGTNSGRRPVYAFYDAADGVYLGLESEGAEAGDVASSSWTQAYRESNAQIRKPAGLIARPAAAQPLAEVSLDSLVAPASQTLRAYQTRAGETASAMRLATQISHTPDGRPMSAVQRTTMGDARRQLAMLSPDRSLPGGRATSTQSDTWAGLSGQSEAWARAADAADVSRPVFPVSDQQGTSLVDVAEPATAASDFVGGADLRFVSDELALNERWVSAADLGPALPLGASFSRHEAFVGERLLAQDRGALDARAQGFVPLLAGKSQRSRASELSYAVDGKVWVSLADEVGSAEASERLGLSLVPRRAAAMVPAEQALQAAFEAQNAGQVFQRAPLAGTVSDSEAGVTAAPGTLIASAGPAREFLSRLQQGLIGPSRATSPEDVASAEQQTTTSLGDVLERRASGLGMAATAAPLSSLEEGGILSQSAVPTVASKIRRAISGGAYAYMGEERTFVRPTVPESEFGEAPQSLTGEVQRQEAMKHARRALTRAVSTGRESRAVTALLHQLQKQMAQADAQSSVEPELSRLIRMNHAETLTSRAADAAWRLPSSLIQDIASQPREVRQEIDQVLAQAGWSSDERLLISRLDGPRTADGDAASSETVGSSVVGMTHTDAHVERMGRALARVATGAEALGASTSSEAVGTSAAGDIVRAQASAWLPLAGSDNGASYFGALGQSRQYRGREWNALYDAVGSLVTLAEAGLWDDAGVSSAEDVQQRQAALGRIERLLETTKQSAPLPSRAEAIAGRMSAQEVTTGRGAETAQPGTVTATDMLSSTALLGLESRVRAALALAVEGPAGASRMAGVSAGQGATRRGSGWRRFDALEDRAFVAAQAPEGHERTGPQGWSQHEVDLGASGFGLGSVLAPEAMLKGMRSPELSQALGRLGQRRGMVGQDFVRVLTALERAGVDLAAARSSTTESMQYELGSAGVGQSIGRTSEAVMPGYERFSRLGFEHPSFGTDPTVEGGASGGLRGRAPSRAGMLSAMLRGGERAEVAGILEKAGGRDFALAWLERVDGTRSGLDLELVETQEAFRKTFGKADSFRMAQDSPISDVSYVNTAASEGPDRSGLRRLSSHRVEGDAGARRSARSATSAMKRTDWRYVQTGSAQGTTHADLGRLASAIVGHSESATRAPMPLVAPAAKAVAQTALRDAKTRSAANETESAATGSDANTQVAGPTKLSDEAIEKLALEMANRVSRLMGLADERRGRWS